MQALHDEFTFERAGLFINPVFPHLGASPDGFVLCKCCGNGLVEIKCPYTQDPNEYIDDKFYLQPSGEVKMQLSHTHGYYLQMQGQMSVILFAGLLLVCTLNGSKWIKMFLMG